MVEANSFYRQFYIVCVPIVLYIVVDLVIVLAGGVCVCVYVWVI